MFDVETFIAEQQARFDAGMAAVRESAPLVPEDKQRFLVTKTDAISNFSKGIKEVAESIARLLPPAVQPPAEMRGKPRPTPQDQPPATPPTP